MTHAEIIALWPTKAEFARAIGVSPSNARSMALRGIPPARFWDVVQAAQKAGFKGVTYAVLVEAAR